MSDALKWFFRFARSYRRPISFVFFLYFVNAALNLIPAYSVRFYLDLVLAGEDVSVFGLFFEALPEGTPVARKVEVTLRYLAGLIGLIVAANAVGVLMWRKGTRTVESILKDLKLALHDHINKLSLRFFNQERVGDIMTKSVADVHNLSMLLRNSFHLTYTLVQFLVAPVLLISLSFWLAMVVVAVMPLVFYALYSIKFRLQPLYREQRTQESAINAQMQEVISGAREIKAFNLDERQSTQYGEINQRYYDLQNRIMRVFSFNHQLQYGSQDLAMVLVAGIGGIMWLHGFGGITLGVIAAFLALIPSFFMPVRQLVGFFDIFQRGLASLDRIHEFLGLVPDIQDAADAKAFGKGELRGEVEFENVGFGYTPEKMLLHGISFRVEAGQKVALVGPTGSGKSTLLSLAMRFYEPLSGSIRIDGHDLRTIRQRALRTNIGVVFQDTFLFYGTIRENLLYINPAKDENDMRRACESAGIHEDILAMPHAYDTFVGERGARLSGGQRQRLAIARVLLADPPVVVLDEATSAVDTMTERRIQASLKHLLKGRTAFIIAHRLSTIRQCDQILVLDEGRIVERGTHDELVARKGRYHKLHLADFG